MTLLTHAKTSSLLPPAPFVNPKTMDDVKKSSDAVNNSSLDKPALNPPPQTDHQPRDQVVKNSLAEPNLKPPKENMANKGLEEPALSHSTNSTPLASHDNSATNSPATKPKHSASSNAVESPSKSKLTQFGSSLKSKLQLLASPSKTKSAPGTPTPGRSSRRMSATSTSSRTPSIKINDSTINIDDTLNGGVQQRLTRSARPGRLPSAMSLKRRKKKKRRVKSEAVLQEKKKDKWADYALKFAEDIELEDGATPTDKWDKYVKNYIKDTDTNFMKKAERKIEELKKKEPLKMEYSSDEEESPGDKKAKTRGKSKMKTRKSSLSSELILEEDSKEPEEDSEDENDLKRRLLESMEKEVDDDDDEPIPYIRSLPPGKPVIKPEIIANNKTYHNGPAVDFTNQIRKLSSAAPQTIDMSQLVIPKKEANNTKQDSKTSQKNTTDITSAIDDILHDEEKKPQAVNNSRRNSAKRDSIKSSSLQDKSNVMPKKNSQENDLKALEDSILESVEKKKLANNRKGSEVDELISELNLAV